MSDAEGSGVPIDSVTVVGPGRIGTAVAQVVATAGYTTRLLDGKDRAEGEERSSLDQSVETIRSNLDFLKEHDAFSGDVDEVLDRIQFTRDPDGAVGQADWVFEALPEDPEVKQAFLREASNFVSEETIVTSGSSTISITTLAEAYAHPEQLFITHWLNPAFIVPLVEVARTDETREASVETITRVLEDVGKEPVVCGDSPGFIGSRIQAGAMNEAVRIIEEGVASPEQIDRAIKSGVGFRLAVLGLVEFIDLGGVDILYYANEYLSGKLGDRFENPETVSEKFNNNELGPKTGKGYYDYDDVDVEAMFNRKYAGFLELLKAIRESDNLGFDVL